MDSRNDLHRARIAKSIDLSRISALTALSPAIVRKIDEGRYEDLPGGLYARSYVRAFAEAIGECPDDAVHAVEDLLPGTPDPLPALRDLTASYRGPFAGWLSENLASAMARCKEALGSRAAQAVPVSTAQERVAADVRSHHGQPAFAALARHSFAPLASSLHNLSGRVAQPVTSPRTLGFAAALVDAMILLGVGIVQAWITAWMCGVTIATLLDLAGAALAALFLVPVVLYFVLFEGIAGRTPGAACCGVARPRRHDPH